MPTNAPTLNSGQQEAADAFFSFLYDDTKEMIISGAGGVGKTFLMGYLIDRVMPQYIQTCALMGIEPEYESVIMTATTNKAAEVLGISTGRPTSTVHSFLNLTVKEDYSTGRARVTKTRNWMVHEKLIVFVDEASMIDGELLILLHEATHKCKIVYVCDHCQLAPVGEDMSPIFKMGIPFYELKEPMRNAGQPALMAICQQLRNTVETGNFQPIKVVPGVIDWASDDDMERMVAQTFRNQTREARILSFTNKRVVEYNEHIRSMRGLPAEYGTGEILVNNNAVQLNKNMLSVEAEIEITSQSPRTENMLIDSHKGKEINLLVRKTSFQSSLGKIYNDVPMPVDRGHYGELMAYYQKAKNWNRYFLLKSIPDVRQRDAATVHKSQGSTYDTVFIDVGNLSTCNFPNIVKRLLYVGFTRARNRVILYGDLAEKYGGLTH